MGNVDVEGAKDHLVAVVVVWISKFVWMRDAEVRDGHGNINGAGEGGEGRRGRGRCFNSGRSRGDSDGGGMDDDRVAFITAKQRGSARSSYRPLNPVHDPRHGQGPYNDDDDWFVCQADSTRLIREEKLVPLPILDILLGSSDLGCVSTR